MAVAPINADSLAVGLLSLLRQRDKQSELRAAGRERAASFTWTASTQNLLAVYGQMMDGNSGHTAERVDGDRATERGDLHRRNLEQAGGGHGAVRFPRGDHGPE